MPEREANRTCTNCTFRRTMRDASKVRVKAQCMDNNLIDRKHMQKLFSRENSEKEFMKNTLL